MITIGEYVTLTVERISDLGYMLSDKKDEVLLHFKQSIGEHKEGDSVKVFIYADKAKRLTATEANVPATLTLAGFAEVVDILPGAGVFVNINTPKDLLLSKDYLPYNEKRWPGVGDKVFIRLKVKHDILTAKPLNRFDIKSLNTEVRYAEGEQVEGYVCHFSEKGIGIVSKGLKYIFVPYTQLRGEYHIGQVVNVTITKELDGEYYGTLNAHKEILMVEDRDIILNYLKSHHGVMKLTAKSSAEEVEALLGMSRKAFKRAYGGLYKDELITFDEEKTLLKDYK